MATSILPIDELNRVSDDIRARFGDGQIPTEDNRREEEDIIDELLDLFLLAYAMGNTVTGERLSSDWTPSTDDVMKVVDARVAGKTWRERVDGYFTDGGTWADIARIADTEMHRIANTAALDTARRAGATRKTWATMLDERVRTSHDYLEGMTVGIDEDFWTWDGNHAPAPGMFGVPEEDCNCRCELLFS